MYSHNDKHEWSFETARIQTNRQAHTDTQALCCLVEFDLCLPSPVRILIREMLLQLADTWTTTTISKRQLLTFTQLLEESRASNFLCVQSSH